MSPCPYHNAFEEEINLRKFDMTKHPTAGLCFFEKDNRTHLATMCPHTPGDRIHYWRTNIRGAWLIAINGTIITSIADAQNAFEQLRLSQAKEATLTFAHPEVSRDISNKGLPILSTEDFSQATLDQLNNRKDILYRKSYDVVDSGHVLNYTTKVSRLTRGKLLQQQDWDDWHQSEYLQLDQYDSQGMFGEPTAVTTDDAIFHLVWTYNIKAADGRKKARCVCDGSTRSGHVKILDETYANCVDQTSARLFYAVTAAENLLTLAQMSPTHLPKPHHQNKVFTSVLTRLSMIGGSIIRNDLPFQPDMSYRSTPPCKATLNHQDYGKNTPTPSYVTLVLRQPYTNHVFTPDSSTTPGSSLCHKLTTLPLHHQTNIPLLFSLT